MWLSTKLMEKKIYWISTEVAALFGCYMTVATWLLPRKLLPSRRVLCTPYKHALSHITSGKAAYVGCMRVAVTCHLYFWPKDQDLLLAIAVTLRWNGYQNMRQHRNLTLEKKILPPFRPGLKPATCRSRIVCFKHLTTPAPRHRSIFSWAWHKPPRAHELCKSWGGRPGLPSLINLLFFCGRKATLQPTTQALPKPIPFTVGLHRKM